jgi:hypothetical protein
MECLVFLFWAVIWCWLRLGCKGLQLCEFPYAVLCVCFAIAASGWGLDWLWAIFLGFKRSVYVYVCKTLEMISEFFYENGKLRMVTGKSHLLPKSTAHLPATPVYSSFALSADETKDTVPSYGTTEQSSFVALTQKL